MSTCAAINCGEPAAPEHNPCCSSHGKPLCCKHYCAYHFVEVNRCNHDGTNTGRGNRR